MNDFDLFQPLELIDSNGVLTEDAKKAIARQMKYQLFLEHLGLLLEGGRPSTGNPLFQKFLDIHSMSDGSLIGKQVAELNLLVKKEVIASLERGMKSLEGSLR